ncbi:hypothetical protein [Halobacterium zhouii]|uniref:hypothetical protein n=1 Tax=Halobacterium zhouii TaxID=2902624 RepID=UPI001E5C4E6F|nr:hypothetical protein [Halobacterium zhouii]
MNPILETTETNQVSADATVRHIDELHDDAQTALSAAAADGRADISKETATNLSDGEVVRFTGYYRVNIAK